MDLRAVPRAASACPLVTTKALASGHNYQPNSTFYSDCTSFFLKSLFGPGTPRRTDPPSRRISPSFFLVCDSFLDISCF